MGTENAKCDPLRRATARRHRRFYLLVFELLFLIPSFRERITPAPLRESLAAGTPLET